jgi:hypothetical protein
VGEDASVGLGVTELGVHHDGVEEAVEREGGEFARAASGRGRW